MKKFLKVFLCSGMIFIYGASVQAESYTVGSDSADDFTTIQSAVDSVVSGDYISVGAGVYTENIIIPNGLRVTITGNSLDNTEVIIKGKILVRANADLTLQYLILNANDKNYGIRIKENGEAIIKYGEIRKAEKYGLLIEPGATAELNEQIIRKSEGHGILARRNSSLGVQNSIIKDNALAGVRAYDTIELSIKDSKLRNNRKGISLKNSLDNNVCWRNDFIKNNVAVFLNKSIVSRQDNTYYQNSRKLVDLQ